MDLNNWLKQEVSRSYANLKGRGCMIKSHLSQLTEQFKVLISQIAAEKLQDIALAQTLV